MVLFVNKITAGANVLPVYEKSATGAGSFVLLQDTINNTNAINSEKE
jgi:hypothetical protein